jgi:hypothetical protein
MPSKLHRDRLILSHPEDAEILKAGDKKGDNGYLDSI